LEFIKCSEQEFFYERINRLTLRTNLPKEEKDYIIKNALERKNLGYFTRKEYLISLTDLINYQSLQIVDEL